MTTSLKNNLDHSRAAHLFAVNSLPDLKQLGMHGVSRSGFRFKTEAHVKSMLIEYGWSFYCRYEGSLEKFLKMNGVELIRRCSIVDWLRDRGVAVSEVQEQGLALYRKIRNQLHHNDGASFDVDPETELHLYPEHMENFYNLFVWLEEQVLLHQAQEQGPQL